MGAVGGAWVSAGAVTVTGQEDDSSELQAPQPRRDPPKTYDN